MSTDGAADTRVVLSAEEIQQRVRQLAAQISADYRGQTLHVVGVLENAFVFMADLIRALDVPVACHFVRAVSREIAGPMTEIFFSPEPDVRGQHVLLVEAVVQSGLTTDFLVSNLLGRGAATVKLAALLDRQAERSVHVVVDYRGFVMDEPFVFGYGLGAPVLGRNLPHLAAAGSQRRPSEAAKAK